MFRGSCRILAPRARAASIPVAPAEDVGFSFKPVLKINHPERQWRRLDKASEGVKVIKNPMGGDDFIRVDSAAIKALAEQAVLELRTQFRQAPLLRQAAVLKDPLATSRDRRVAFEFLQQACHNVARIDQRNAVFNEVNHVSVSVGKGANVVTDGNLGLDISKFVRHLDFDFDIHCSPGAGLDFMFAASGRHFQEVLHQKVPAILTEKNLSTFFQDEINALDNKWAPYRFFACVGGLSVEHTTKVAQMMSWNKLDGLPTVGGGDSYGYRDIEWEKRILDQWGYRDGFMRHFLSMVRVCRLPRHGASCPISIILSSIDDRKSQGKITADGVFAEVLEENPAMYLPEVVDRKLPGGPYQRINVDKTASLHDLRELHVGSKILITGSVVTLGVQAHRRMRELLDNGQPLPDYMYKYPIFYAKRGQVGWHPLTAARLDGFFPELLDAGSASVTIGAGPRNKEAIAAAMRHNAVCLGFMGGAAAHHAFDHAKYSCIDHEDLGEGAVYKIELSDQPAYVECDWRTGNEFQSVMWRYYSSQGASTSRRHT